MGKKDFLDFFYKIYNNLPDGIFKKDNKDLLKNDSDKIWQKAETLKDLLDSSNLHYRFFNINDRIDIRFMVLQFKENIQGLDEIWEKSGKQAGPLGKWCYDKLLEKLKLMGFDGEIKDKAILLKIGDYSLNEYDSAINGIKDFHDRIENNKGNLINAINEIQKTDEYKKIVEANKMEEKNMKEQFNDEKFREDVKTLLLNNRNIILHGAPGTGKTYLAKEIAKELIFSTEAGFSAEDKALIEKKESEVGETEKERFATLKKQFNEQCGFVQFHQSYDYTDFVEGLRPTKDSNDKVDGFELKPGIFRTFCEKAVKNIEDSNKKISESKDEKNFNSKFNKVVNQIKNDDLETIELKTGKKMIVIDVSRSNTILLKTEGTTSNRVYRVSFNRLAKLAQKYPTIESMNVSNIDEAVKEVIGGSHSSAYWAVLKFIHSQKLDVDVKDHKKIELRTFVFVIDEINRGEMSKIFGELFFSIDPGYRGKKGAIRTQYANLQDEANDFDSALGILDDNDENFGHFFVPENVYIIGTMNDIDRSVESMDFAMRRRFAFKEITAEESQESMFSTAEQWKKSTKTDVIIDENLLDDIKNRMNNLNKAILNKEFNLGHAYQIGGAYFLKFANYFDQKKDNAADAFDSLWTNHLQCILREYLRGMDNVEGDDGLLKKLENAYKEPDKYKYGKNGELEEKNASQPAAVNPGDEKGDGE